MPVDMHVVVDGLFDALLSDIHKTAGILATASRRHDKEEYSEPSHSSTIIVSKKRIPCERMPPNVSPLDDILSNVSSAHDTRDLMTAAVAQETCHQQQSKPRDVKASDELDNLLKSLNEFKRKENQRMCDGCKGPITERECVTAMGKTWHRDHFCCEKCKQPIGENLFHEKDGVAYCERDFLEMHAPNCGQCKKPIIHNYISALGKQWHAACFHCMECSVSFGSANFFDHNGDPYCEAHYYAKQGSVCANCMEPIKGRCISAMHKKFHPDHFICVFCLKQLNNGTFKEQNNKPYCNGCFVKLFG